MCTSRFARLFVVFLILASIAPGAQAQWSNQPGYARRLVTEPVDEGKRVTLSGNVHPEATPEHSRGPVSGDLMLEHLLLQLKRSPEQEQALDKFLEGLHTKGSPNYQQWISADEFGQRFGVSQDDIDELTRWLEKHGLTVNVVYTSRMVIDFSGTAQKVSETFHTEIHNLRAKGRQHFGNVNDPQVPAAFAPVVAGIVSLHNFPPHDMHLMRKTGGKFTFGDQFGNTNYALVPADLATIYNLNPLFNSGLSGQGQTIVVIEDTDVFSAADWKTFRSTLGLSKYTSGSFKTIYPAPAHGTNNCNKPGILAPNDAEAILDAEWASAAAPNAAIVMATCADTTTTFGGLIALQNLINSRSQPPAIMSVSYGQCETENGAAANAAYNSAYQQAASEGVSVFVAAGDSGAAGCDNGATQATHGIGVNAFASTPYNVAVGGTDFSDTYSGTNSSYWGSTNSSSFGSALSYIPEIPWNDSCAGALFANFEGYNITYGSNSFCNDPSLGPFVLSTVAGGGGPSACATGTPSVTGVVSGTCKGWPKPSWQSIYGNPSDGVRDTPDVSLFAADGLWSHYYVFCWSDTANGGAACTGDPTSWVGAGGTSFASPIMAGIQALANQKAGARQGNPNPTYYQLAANEYSTSNLISCNSSNGNTVPSSCVFYDVTQGDIDVNCIGNAGCFLDSAQQGVLSTSDTSFKPAYPATAGWDFATGIGTVNAANLVNSWPGSKPTFTLSTTASSLNVPQGGSASTSVVVNPLNGFNATVSFSVSGLPSGVTASFNPGNSNTGTTLTFTASSGATLATATATITGSSGSVSTTTTVSVTVIPPGTFSLSASPNTVSVVQGNSGTSLIAVVPQNGFAGSVSLTASGLPSGVTASFNPASTTSNSTLTLSVGASASPGSSTVTITGTSGALNAAVVLTLTVNPAPTYSLAASPNNLSILQGTSGNSSVTVAPQNGFTGSVSLTASGLPSGVTASFNPASTTGSSTLTLSANSIATTGTFPVTITGSANGLSKTATLSLTVVAAPLPSNWADLDVGPVGLTGSASYANGIFTVNGSGQYIWDAADEFNFAYQPLAGDGTIVARVLSVQGGATGQGAGVMIRESLSYTSTNALAVFGGSNSEIYLTDRTATTGLTSANGNSSPVTLPYWVKLIRSGTTFTAYASPDGSSWTQLGSTQISMAQNVYIGLAVCSSDNSRLTTATFDNVSVTVPPPDFGLSASPASVTVVQGGSGSSTITIAPRNGFAGGVALSATGLPSGVTASFSPASATSTSSLTFTVDSSVATGTFPVTVTGTSGALTHTATMSLTVAIPPSFGLSASQTNMNVPQGGSGTSTITVAPQNGFVGTVSFAASGLPNGVSATFNPNSATISNSSNGTSSVTLSASSTATTGSATVTITGTSGALTSTTTVNVTVTPPPNFTLSASPTGLSIGQGGSGSSTISITQQNGFTGSVALTASGLPNGVTATFNPANTTGSSILTLAAGSAATTGIVNVTITGTSGGLTQTTVLQLTVTATGGPLPSGWADLDIGPMWTTGSASYASGVFTVNGSGQYVWNAADEFNFAYQPLPGDGTIVARILSVQGGAPSQGAGVMIRETLNYTSSNAYTVFGGGNSEMYLTARTSTAGQTSSLGNSSPVTLPYWVKLVRSGTTFTGYASPDGSTWTQVGSTQISMAQNVYVGLAVSSNDNNLLTTATFDNVSISIPPPNFSLSAAPATVTVGQGSIGSSTITVVPQNGFNGGVALSATGLPAGVTASFNPANATGTSTLTFTANGSATTGTFPVTITGVSGSVTQTTTITLNVTVAGALPPGWTDLDIGPMWTLGSASYANGVFTVKGSGQYVWNAADEFNYAYQSLSGDGTIIARILSVQGGAPSQGAGVMIRETLNYTSSNAYTVFGGGNSEMYLTARTSTAGQTSSFGNSSPVTLPYWVKLVRSGNTLTGYTSADGVNWGQVGTVQINMLQNVYIGLAVGSSDNNLLTTATFDNVSVTTP